jgi:Ser/Thr protein kinase RdoA (MazF antagonist)
MVLRRKPVERQFDVLPRSVLAEAIGEYDVGELEHARTLVVEGDRVIILSDKSETSRKYVIDTSRGTYFLKEVPWYCDDPGHRNFSRRLMNHLADAGLPVPRTLRTRAGTWHATVGDSSFVLLEYLPGSPYRHRGDQARSASATLAALHLAAADLDVGDDAPRESLCSIVSEHFDLAGRLWSIPPGRQAQFDELRVSALSWIGADQEGDDPPTAVHGDYIPWNLGFSPEGEVMAIHDFDNSCVDSRLHDIGEALSAFFLVPHAGTSAILKPVGVTEPPVELISDFLRCYHIRSALAGDELRRLRGYTIGAWLESVLLSCVRGDQSPAVLDVMSAYPAELMARWPAVISFAR